MINRGENVIGEIECILPNRRNVLDFLLYRSKYPTGLFDICFYLDMKCGHVWSPSKVFQVLKSLERSHLVKQLNPNENRIRFTEWIVTLSKLDQQK